MVLFVNSNRDNCDHVIANLEEGHQGYGKVDLQRLTLRRLRETLGIITPIVELTPHIEYH